MTELSSHVVVAVLVAASFLVVVVGFRLASVPRLSRWSERIVAVTMLFATALCAAAAWWQYVLR